MVVGPFNYRNFRLPAGLAGALGFVDMASEDDPLSLSGADSLGRWS